MVSHIFQQLKTPAIDGRLMSPFKVIILNALFLKALKYAVLAYLRTGAFELIFSVTL